MHESDWHRCPTDTKLVLIPGPAALARRVMLGERQMPATSTADSLWPRANRGTDCQDLCQSTDGNLAIAHAPKFAAPRQQRDQADLMLK